MTIQHSMSDDEKQMRRSFRIRENAFVRITLLNDADYAALLEARSLQQPSRFGNNARLVNLEARFQEAFALLGTAPQPVRDCLATLNDKLSLLLDEQPERKAAIQQLTEGTALMCEIGATGIRFDHHEPLPEDSKLFLQVMLTADRHYLETPAVVRRPVGLLNQDPHAQHGVAAEFVGFSEAESELLIKHLFQRESESLRMRRLAADD
ncbi:MAG: hypothetical protein AAFO81_00275 [Pseudomonadota bacterium]